MKVKNHYCRGIRGGEVQDGTIEAVPYIFTQQIYPPPGTS